MKAVDKATKAKEPLTRLAGAGALAVLPTEDREERWKKLLGDEDLRVQAAALAEAARAAEPGRVPALLALLQQPGLTNVIERRVDAALVATFAKVTDAARAATLAEPIDRLRIRNQSTSSGRTA
jgi:hypothetical protein